MMMSNPLTCDDMEELFFGIMEQECVMTALAEHRNQAEAVGNHARAALCTQLQAKLERSFRLINDNAK